MRLHLSLFALVGIFCLQSHRALAASLSKRHVRLVVDYKYTILRDDPNPDPEKDAASSDPTPDPEVEAVLQDVEARINKRLKIMDEDMRVPDEILNTATVEVADTLQPIQKAAAAAAKAGIEAGEERSMSLGFRIALASEAPTDPVAMEAEAEQEADAAVAAERAGVPASEAEAEAEAAVVKARPGISVEESFTQSGAGEESTTTGTAAVEDRTAGSVAVPRTLLVFVLPDGAAEDPLDEDELPDEEDEEEDTGTPTTVEIKSIPHRMPRSASNEELANLLEEFVHFIDGHSHTCMEATGCFVSTVPETLPVLQPPLQPPIGNDKDSKRHSSQERNARDFGEVKESLPPPAPTTEDDHPEAPRKVLLSPPPPPLHTPPLSVGPLGFAGTARTCAVAHGEATTHRLPGAAPTLRRPAVVVTDALRHILWDARSAAVTCGATGAQAGGETACDAETAQGNAQPFAPSDVASLVDCDPRLTEPALATCGGSPAELAALFWASYGSDAGLRGLRAAAASGTTAYIRRFCGRGRTRLFLTLDDAAIDAIAATTGVIDPLSPSTVEEAMAVAAAAANARAVTSVHLRRLLRGSPLAPAVAGVLDAAFSAALIGRTPTATNDQRADAAGVVLWRLKGPRDPRAVVHVSQDLSAPGCQDLLAASRGRTADMMQRVVVHPFAATVVRRRMAEEVAQLLQRWASPERRAALAGAAGQIATQECERTLEEVYGSLPNVEVRVDDGVSRGR